MPKLFIDGREVEVEEGQTLLDAARRLGIEIPTLCAYPGLPPSTSCLTCVVKLEGRDRMLPSCATRAEEGMRVESETAEVHEARRTALELLFSDHLGECRSPCSRICPLDLNVPLVLRQMQAGDPTRATLELRQALPLPGVLGRLCPAHCEQGCRRSAYDDGAAIRAVERSLADADRSEPHLPPQGPASGRRVAIVGSGPTGLSAAYFLRLQGHACTIFEARDQAGGTLRDPGDPRLDADVLDDEIGLIQRLGADLRVGTELGRDVSLEELSADFDAVLIATGAGGDVPGLSLPGAENPDRVPLTDPATFRTRLEGVFAAGDATRASRGPVHAMADGKRAAVAIGQHLSGAIPTGPTPLYGCSFGRLKEGEVAEYLGTLTAAGREARAGDRPAELTLDEARREAQRCLSCDCASLGSCSLQTWGERYGASPSRHKAERRRFRRLAGHPYVVFEPGKCILCGICIQIAEQAREPLGLSFVGRGFDVELAVPFDRTLADGLQKTARRCIDACPTGALAPRADRRPDQGNGG